MTSTVQEYSVDQEIIDFFRKTTATRSECDAAAKDLVGGDVIPVDVQGVCSYTVYAGPKQEFVVQFRLRSLSLKPETAALAREIHGDLTPEISFKGQIGADFDVNGREPLNIYVMTRIKGVSRLDFILAHEEPENSLEYFSWRKTLITDVARFVSLSLRVSFYCRYFYFEILILACLVSLPRRGKNLKLSISRIKTRCEVHTKENCNYYLLPCLTGFIPLSNNLSTLCQLSSHFQWYYYTKTLATVILWLTPKLATW